MSIFNNKNNELEVLGQIEIIGEIKKAAKENRPADFSNKILADFNVIIDKIMFGLNLENAKILGPVFLGEIVVIGDLNLRNAVINGSLYLGKSDIKQNLILENAQINGAINLVGSKIGGDINARGLIAVGFLSLAKTEIFGDVILENAEIESAKYDDLMIRGDVFLGASNVKGSLNLGKMKTEGMIDLDETNVGSNLVLTGTQSQKGNIDTTTVKIGGKKII
ncbi:MAG: hypothetical protein WC319_00915 [Candidatus Paceibacterota bacterium]|jgi:hypothetical protein